MSPSVLSYSFYCTKLLKIKRIFDNQKIIYKETQWAAVALQKIVIIIFEIIKIKNVLTNNPFIWNQSGST